MVLPFETLLIILLKKFTQSTFSIVTDQTSKRKGKSVNISKEKYAKQRTDVYLCINLYHIKPNMKNNISLVVSRSWNFNLWLHLARLANSKAFFLNPFAPGDFAEKPVLKLVEWFPGHCRAIKSQNLPKTHLPVVHFTAFWSRCKISACEVRACAESKISSLKSDTAVLTFPFRFLSSPLFSLFLPHFFFSCWAFSRLCFSGKSF